MTETARVTTFESRSRADAVREWALAHWFALGVAGVTAVAAAFLLHQLMAWPPHEDETLALFVGRNSASGVIEQVTRERGGAPLHFIIAWGVAHLGFGLGGLRYVSAAFALASLPLIALLGRRLVGPLPALVATVLVAASWGFLFHGVYGRMYSLFLFLSAATFLALLRALDRGGRGPWALWVAATLLCVSAHPYGALVLAVQLAYILVARRDRLRSAAWSFGAVAVLGIPFWITDLVLAGRFDVGVGSGSVDKLGGPWEIARYLARSAGDFSSGWWPVLAAVLVLAAIGFVTAGREARLLVAAAVLVPTLAFSAARLGGSASPESRHLIFVLPLFAVLVAVGLLRVTSRAPVLAVLAVSALVFAEVAWAWHRTSPLFEWEPDARQAARAEAESFLATTSLPDDILFGYEPLYLGAWERARDFPRTVLPRADHRLALRTLERHAPALGRGVWVLDASERNNVRPRLEIEALAPKPAEAFETRAFGPFLVLRTRDPVGSIDRYLGFAASAMVVGRSLGIGDADINLLTIERADRIQRGYGASRRLRSDTSR
ncbi:MAG TPA: glycosyltransferase family 39 protein [Gaiella sp.]|jgi:hypothetical protein